VKPALIAFANGVLLVGLFALDWPPGWGTLGSESILLGALTFTWLQAEFDSQV